MTMPVTRKLQGLWIQILGIRQLAVIVKCSAMLPGELGRARLVGNRPIMTNTANYIKAN